MQICVLWWNVSWSYYKEKAVFRNFAVIFLPCRLGPSLIYPAKKEYHYKGRVDSSWNVMLQGDALEGKWRGNWRMDWVVSTLHTTSEHGVSSITTADAHNSAASSQLNWRPPADLNGLVRFAERLNLVSVRVPSRFNWPLHAWQVNSTVLHDCEIQFTLLRSIIPVVLIKTQRG